MFLQPLNYRYFFIEAFKAFAGLSYLHILLSLTTLIQAFQWFSERFFDFVADLKFTSEKHFNIFTKPMKAFSLTAFPDRGPFILSFFPNPWDIGQIFFSVFVFYFFCEIQIKNIFLICALMRYLCIEGFRRLRCFS